MPELSVETGTLALYCPIPLVLHPNAAAVQGRSFAWMERFRLFGDGRIPRENALATESARVTGSMMPSAPDDLLLLFVTYMYWGFMVDDLVDVGTPEQRSQQYRELAPRLLRALESPLVDAPDDPPYVALFRDMRGYVAQHASPAQTRLWVDAFHEWLLGVALELVDARCGVLPTVDGYLFIKMFSSAARAVTSTLEICGGGGELPAEERESPAVTALTQAVSVLMNLYADLFSHGKEASGDYNIINVLMAETGVDRDAAVGEAIGLCDRVMVLFLRLRAEVAPRVTPQTRAYLDNLGATLSGVLDWCATAARLKSGRATRLERVDQPSRADTGAPPYPNIAWWWDQLDSSQGSR
ncbi:hypothetical protein SAMN05192558_101296 [Actinokineospora alba]|uniref:Terpene synthase n=1 Tax=Actinokineospora alba TaxID=504798 RepID=A0A1H0FAB8_9PSEU|nr:hypothetical protein [Actinokineospora alba]TDP69405.1 hypothetical protein C8E96_4992 [Actinokineospora alba]SDI17411.1 hypothetical protein SAMN05421871_103574 [Actinokineospora alba]SDN91667.1 hypothetical protein SAMN05192558_101296 [Actinokineospora alba]